MSLQFLMPTVPGLGVWQLDTSSYHSIVNIYSGMELVRGLFGTVAMVPLTLSLEPMEVSPDGRKKTVYVLHLRSKGTLAEIAEQKAHPLVPSLIPAPDEEREDLLYPEHGFAPEPVSAPPAPGPRPEPAPAPAPPSRPKPRAAQSNDEKCPQHERTWGKTPNNRIGHPLGNGQWCYREEQTAPAPAPEPAAADDPAAPETASVTDGVPSMPETREGLEAWLEALGWDWASFESDVLHMSWSDWEKLAGEKAMERAKARFQNLDPVEAA